MIPQGPLVSIVVPSFNQGAFIGETVRSVLDQAYRPIEIVVVDGASTDATLDVLRSFGEEPELRWVSEPDSGVVEAVNKGLAMARGEIAGIQSSDDAYLPGAVEAAVGALATDPDLAFVFGDIVKVDESGAEISREVLGPYSLESVLAKETWIPQPSTFFRLALARELGGWRDEVPYAADTDLWLRMAVGRRARKLDRFMAIRRMHGAQRDLHGDRIVRDYERMLDTVPGIADGPGPVRRAALAGRLLHRNRYGGNEPAHVQRRRARRAVVAWPPLLRTYGPSIFLPARPRELAGVMLLDLPRWAWTLGVRGDWTRLRNRGDRLVATDAGPGVALEQDRWSSDLHACHVLPSLGARAWDAAFERWPVGFADAPAAGEPVATFVVPFRGADRVEQMGAVVRSILAQDVPVECLVVEQSRDAVATGLPEAVRHVHLPHPLDPEGWHKAWAFNEGARRARTDVLVCHDADILVPRGYARELLRHLGPDGGMEVAHLHRFLFCLDREDTAELLRTGRLPREVRPERVRQNWEGGTLGVRREAFFRIGGYDEDFVGWGGEDNEFYDRCRMLDGWRFGYVPFVHLRHPPQPQKAGEGRQGNLDLMEARLGIPREERAARLAGKLASPAAAAVGVGGAAG